MQNEGNEDDYNEECANVLSVETLAQAAVALRNQSSGGSSGSSRELKLNWKQAKPFFFVFTEIVIQSFLLLVQWTSIYAVIIVFLFKDSNG